MGLSSTAFQSAKCKEEVKKEGRNSTKHWKMRMLCASVISVVVVVVVFYACYTVLFKRLLM